MGSAKTMAAVAAAAFISIPAAQAADLPVPVPVIHDFSGWYLRGDIGMSNEKLKGLSHPSFATATAFTWYDRGGFDSAPFFGLGIGYAWNSWLRFDVTGEYRGKADFHALDRFLNAGVYNTNDYTGSKSEWLFLANVYFDLGTWWYVTPFVGAGIGITHNIIAHFRDTNVIAGGGGWADTGTQTNFAWALYAGAAYQVTPQVTLEFAYRYLDLGDARTGTLVNLDPTIVGTNRAPMTFRDITSHDLKFGVRWMLEPPEQVFAPPLIRKG
ncbi:MAG TPA: outer membrane beta-barrel protein [Xanthobacteraceae bacterium]